MYKDDGKGYQAVAVVFVVGVVVVLVGGYFLIF